MSSSYRYIQNLSETNTQKKTPTKQKYNDQKCRIPNHLLENQSKGRLRPPHQTMAHILPPNQPAPRDTSQLTDYAGWTQAKEMRRERRRQAQVMQFSWGPRSIATTAGSNCDQPQAMLLTVMACSSVTDWKCYKGGPWWCMSVVPVLRRLRHDERAFETSLSNIASSRLVWAM